MCGAVRRWQGDRQQAHHEDFCSHFVAFQGVRNKYFDDCFAWASASGVRRIVMLEAGLDSRTDRLSWPDGTVAYGLDQPRVLQFTLEMSDTQKVTPGLKMASRCPPRRMRPPELPPTATWTVTSTFSQLIYNQKFAKAADWFGAHG